MAFRQMDAGGVLRTVSTFRLQDGGTVRRLLRMRVLDEDGTTLRTVATFVQPLSVSVGGTMTAVALGSDQFGQPTDYALSFAASAVPSGGLAPFTYSWAIISGSGWSISGPTTASPTIYGYGSTATAATARVTVTDSSGQTATADLAITF